MAERFPWPGANLRMLFENIPLHHLLTVSPANEKITEGGWVNAATLTSASFACAMAVIFSFLLA